MNRINKELGQLSGEELFKPNTQNGWIRQQKSQNQLKSKSKSAVQTTKWMSSTDSTRFMTISGQTLKHHHQHHHPHQQHHQRKRKTKTIFLHHPRKKIAKRGRSQRRQALSKAEVNQLTYRRSTGSSNNMIPTTR